MKTNMNGFNLPKKLLMVALVLIVAFMSVFAEAPTYTSVKLTKVANLNIFL